MKRIELLLEVSDTLDCEAIKLLVESTISDKLFDKGLSSLVKFVHGITLPTYIDTKEVSKESAIKNEVVRIINLERYSLSSKIAAIKYVRDAKGIGLKEAADYVTKIQEEMRKNER